MVRTFPRIATSEARRRCLRATLRFLPRPPKNPQLGIFIYSKIKLASLDMTPQLIFYFPENDFL